MLRLEGVRIDLGGFTLEADLSVEPGAKVAILGPSGSGKSTLLSVIAGFQALAQGRVLWEGRDLTSEDPGARPLTILFQENNLFPHLTTRQNVGLGIKPSLRLSVEDWGQVDQALASVGLGDLGARRPAALSGGQRSRVVLARALVRARPLVLMDEPFAALGPAQKVEMLGLVDTLADQTGATVLMVTHDPGDARAFADQMILVAEGRAHAPAPTEALFADPPPALKAYIG